MSNEHLKTYLNDYLAGATALELLAQLERPDSLRAQASGLREF